MTRYTKAKFVYFALLWICICAAEVEKHDDPSERTDIDFSFLEGETEPEGWVDPFHMFDYKPSTGNLKTANVKDSGKIEDETTTPTEKYAKKNQQLTACDGDNKMQQCRDDDFASYQELTGISTKDETNSCKDEEFIFLKRTANMILNKIRDLKQDSPSDALHIILTITEDTVSTLKAFLGAPCKHVQEFDSVIAVTLHNAELTNSYNYIEPVYSYLHQFFQSEITLYCITIFVAVLSLWGQLLRLSIWQIIPRLIVFIYFLSFAWNWVLLIKIETASAYAEAQKTSPSECHKNDVGVYKKISLIISSIFSGDKCKQYYEAVLVEPVWKVSPLVALSKTTSELFFHPLGSLGHHLGYFFQNLFSAVSWYLLVPVCVIVTICILLLLLVMFGYRIRIFPFLCLEPGRQYSREQNQLISDVLEGRVHIQRTDSNQIINVNERLTHYSSCSDVNRPIDQNAIEEEVKKKSSNEKGTQTTITGPSSLSSMCCDRLAVSTVNSRIQEMVAVP